MSIIYSHTRMSIIDSSNNINADSSKHENKKDIIITIFLYVVMAGIIIYNLI